MKEIPQNIKLALKEAKDVLDQGGAEAIAQPRGLVGRGERRRRKV